MRKGLKRRLVLATAFAALGGALIVAYAAFITDVNGSRRRYPSLAVLGMAVLNYAEDYGGALPAGGPNPASSLALLSKDEIDASFLRADNASEAVVADKLRRGEPLPEALCRWHYVEGLTLADDPALAVLWEKTPYYGNARRVFLLRGQPEYIPANEWKAFLREQRRLYAFTIERPELRRPILTAKVRLPSGEVVSSYDGAYSLRRQGVSAGSGYASSGIVQIAGDPLREMELQWHRYDFAPEETFTLVLELPAAGLRSQPIKVVVKNRIAKPSQILFDMSAIADSDR